MILFASTIWISTVRALSLGIKITDPAKFPSPSTDRLTESKRIELKSLALNINYNIMNSVVVMY
jgi:hypothetical protein